MAITKEHLLLQLQALQQQEAEHQSGLIAVRGAIQFCTHLLQIEQNNEKAVVDENKLTDIPRPSVEDAVKPN